MKLAREGVPFVAVPALLALGAAFLPAPWPWVAALPVAFALFSAWFFRDPERRTPGAAGALIAPADGKILKVGPEEISIFMNVFDVHVCRAPWPGRIRAVEHHRGRFLAAWDDRAPEQNERADVWIADEARAATGAATGAGPGALRCRLIAGLVARRIICRVAAGQSIRAGERLGLIRFGSRVDVQVPPGARVSVTRGQRVRAGETILARAASAADAGDDVSAAETNVAESNAAEPTAAETDAVETTAAGGRP